MNKTRWLFVLLTVASAVVVGLLVAPAGGSPRAGAAASKGQLCSTPPPKHVSARDIKRYARRVGNRIFIICQAVANGGPGRRGTTGPPGAPGPNGAQGPAGQNNLPTRVVIPLTDVTYQDPNQPLCDPSQTAPACRPDGGHEVTLAQVGPIHIDGLCRTTKIGPGGGEHGPTYPAPFAPLSTPGGENEAQVIVWSETGSLSFKGQAGHRENVPPGPPDYLQAGYTIHAPSDTSNGGTANPVHGEGQHIFAVASDEEVDEIRGTDPATNPGGENGAGVTHLPEFPYMQYGGGAIVTSEGHFVWANMLAGINVLGVYNRLGHGGCVFAGLLRPVS